MTQKSIGLLIMKEVFPSETIDNLKKDYEVHIFNNIDSLKPIAAQIEAIATGGGPGVSDEIMDILPNLKIIAVNGVGTDAINLTKAKERNIQVTTTIGMPTDDVADMTMALTLALKRHIIFNDRYVKQGNWKNGMPSLASSLTGCKMGIAGFGAIGQAIANRALASKMKIGYFARHKKDFKEATYFSHINDLATWSDVLVLAVPGGPETENIVNADTLNHLGKDGYLVNIARGSVIDEGALIKALQMREIAGAGLDVFLNEPLIDPAFFTLPNVILQPHQGSATKQTRKDMGENVISNLKAFFNHEKLLTPLF